MTHYILKILPQFYEAVASGYKTCELRKEDDKTFRVKDILDLCEWDPERKTFTTRLCTVMVTHIVRHEDFDAIPEGYAMLSIGRIR